jgi:precorrin-3B synthase
MASGDGLLVRVRPPLARLTLEQALGLCELSQTLGSGIIDLTHRANLQLRGVKPSDHDAVVQTLCSLGLVDVDPAREALPAVLVAPCWQAGDDTQRIATALLARLDELPALPSKFGFAVDAGPAPVLVGASADVRIERARSGGLIVRADGAAAGHRILQGNGNGNGNGNDDVDVDVDVEAAVEAALSMAMWFAATAGSVQPPSRRMRLHQRVCLMPLGQAQLDVAAYPVALPEPGMSTLGPVYGVAFGQIEAAAFAHLLRDSGAAAVRLTPQRSLILEGAAWRESKAFLSVAGDPLLRVDACPGAPSCASATVATRTVARALALQLQATGSSGLRSVHVSGCAKGCARAGSADFTLVGRDGTFDLVRHGRAWDTPSHTGLSPDALRPFLGTP